MRVRAVLNGNILDVVDGEPQTSSEVGRAVADRMIAIGVFEEVGESVLTTPEAPLRNVAHGDPTAGARAKRRGP